MGFALTVLYLVTTYLGADTVFGPLVVFHVELIIAVIVILLSLPLLPGSMVMRTPQLLALVGLSLAVFLSLLVTGWFGGAVKAFQSFIPNAFAYFLVGLHCNSRKKLQVIVLLLVFVCLFVIAHGLSDLAFVVPQLGSLHGSGDATPYLYEQGGENGQPLYRLRGQGFINDPNDFAQLIVCTIPLLFIFWKPKSTARNLFFVLLPASVLVYGAFLTHSRGFLMAFLAMTIMAGRRRIGIVPSLIGAVVFFLGASRMGFTGGRNLESGSGRMVLWAMALGLLKSHPLLGVGFGRLPDYIGMTAHNSIVVCATELGFFGLFFWSLFLFPTMRDAFALTSPDRVSEAGPLEAEDSPFQKPLGEGFDKAGTLRMGELTLLSLTGFLVTGFFISRAFVLTLFLLGGITEVVFEQALRRGMIAPRMKLDRVLLRSGALALALVLFVYVLLHLAL